MGGMNDLLANLYAVTGEKNTSICRINFTMIL
jgi:hypothetical protein